MGNQVVTNSHPPLRRLSVQAVKCQVWLSGYRKEIRNAGVLWKLWSKTAKGSPRDLALWAGYWAVTRDNEETVEAIRERGGLLLIGGAA